METIDIVTVILTTIGGFAIGLYIGANIVHELYRKALNIKLEKE